MKIKKYQNPSGPIYPISMDYRQNAEGIPEGTVFGWTPELGFHYEQPASDVDYEMSDITKAIAQQSRLYTEAKEQELKQRFDAIKQRTAGLGEADSATDWYHAMEEDPVKRAEWDRNAALTNTIGASIATLPWTVAGGIAAGKNIFDLAKFGLTSPVGKQAAAKALVSTLGGEAMYQMSEAGKQRLNESSIGDSTFNTQFAQPFLTAFAIGFDPDSIMAKNATRGIVNDVARDMFSNNASRARMTFGDYSKNFADNIKTPIYSGQHDQLIQKFGPDFMEEAFPFLPEYAKGLDPSVQKMAKEAYLSELISGNAFKANGTNIRPNGAEITRRGIAKRLGYGNDGLLWARASSIDHLTDPHQITYSAMFEPGVVDKYLITDNGSTIKGLFKEADQTAYYKLLDKQQSLRKDASNRLARAIESNDRQAAIEAYRDIIRIESVLPSKVQKWNATQTLKPGTKHYDELAMIGEEYMRRLGSSADDLPLQHGLEFKIGNDRVVEPLVVNDSADILYLPDFQHIDKKSKQTAQDFLDELKKTPDYKNIIELFEPRLLEWTENEIKKGNTGHIYQDIINEIMSLQDTNLATVMRAYSPDSTKGVGRVPIQSVTEDGFSKGIGSLASGKFDYSDKNILRKHGGKLTK